MDDTIKIPKDNTIKINRGNDCNITVGAKNEDGSNYIFKTDDVLRIKIFKVKDCGSVVLQKDTKIQTDTTKPVIHLTSEDTRFCDLINKPATYWYEILLNPDTAKQTIVGYEDDPAEFILRPEGGSYNGE